MIKVKQAYRNFERYRQILSVLISYGFDNIMGILHLDSRLSKILPLKHKPDEQVKKLTQAQRLRKVIEELGPTFIKLAQILSSRPDLIPMDIVEEFTLLQDAVSPVPFSEIEEVIQDELGTHWEGLFSSINREPLASASIAQVYEAVLHSGDKVVLKVQRPGIQKTIAADLDILEHLAKLAEDRSEDLRRIQPIRIVEEFSKALSRELDFTVEEANIELFASNFRKEKKVCAPKVYSELTTKRVIVMEQIEGVKPSSAEVLIEADLSPEEIAVTGARSVMEQIFSHGFFHADPHPGNLIILPDNKICYIDFGMVGRVSRKDREEFANLLKSLILRDDRHTAALILHFADFEVKPDMEHLERDITELIDIYISRSIEKIDATVLLKDIQKILIRYDLSIKPHIYLMMKALATVEGLGRALDPGFHVPDHLLPFARKLWMRKYNPVRFTTDLLGLFQEGAYFFRDLPEDIRELVAKARNGKMAVEFRHSGLDAMMETLDRISNRVTFAIIQAAIIIGSSLIIHSRIPPYWNEIPIIGLIGFLFAGVLGGIILINIIHKRKM